MMIKRTMELPQTDTKTMAPNMKVQMVSSSDMDHMPATNMIFLIT